MCFAAHTMDTNVECTSDGCQQGRLVLSAMHADNDMQAQQLLPPTRSVSHTQRDELLCDAEDDRLLEVVVREIMLTQAARDDVGVDAIEPDHVRLAGDTLNSEAVDEDAHPASGDEEGEESREG
ncbi:hypothetical protein GGI03_006990, partial [Coemansia sp. RSA 2337]